MAIYYFVLNVSNNNSYIKIIIIVVKNINILQWTGSARNPMTRYLINNLKYSRGGSSETTRETLKRCQGWHILRRYSPHIVILIIFVS